jgi:hypothetical protein
MNEEEILEFWNRMVAESRREVRPRLIEFYHPHIADPNLLIDTCYAYPTNIPAQMLHVLHRLVAEIADQSQTDHLKAFWLVVCAESIIKLRGNHPQGSRKCVVEFFRQTGDIDRKNLEENLVLALTLPLQFPLNLDKDNRRQIDLRKDQTLTPEEIANLLYNIRNLLVHEGIYYEFDFSLDGEVPMFQLVDCSPYPDKPDIKPVEINLTYQDLRGIVIRTGIKIIQDYLDTQSTANSELRA